LTVHGFCIFNSLAVAAAWLLAEAERNNRDPRL
jgi:acetoin utilization deacetylase AcuC-like enzyme